MHGRRRPSTDVNNIGDGGLLRQVLTRNLMTVTLDPPPESTEEPDHLSDEPAFLKTREPCRQPHYHPGYNAKNDNSRDKQLTSYSTSCMSPVSQPSSDKSPCICWGGGQGSCTCSCSSFNGGFLTTDESRSLQHIHTSLPTSATKFSEYLASKEGSDQNIDTANADERDACCEPGRSRPTCGVDKEWDHSDRCFSDGDRDSERYCFSCSEYDTRSDGQASCVGCDCQSLPKYQKTEESSGFGSAGASRNISHCFETPKICRPVSTLTAFPFPSPISQWSSTSDRPLWTPDYNTASALCSTFARLVSSNGDGEETLPLPFSSVNKPEDVVPVSSSSCLLNSTQGIMAPTQELPSPINQRSSFPLSPNSVGDFSFQGSRDIISPLSDMRAGSFRRNSDMRSKATTESCRCVTPKLIQRSDLTFGPVIGKGGFGRVHEGKLQDLPVAIKVVQKRRGSGIHREILQAERLAFSLRLRHANIVHILGVNVCDDLRGEALIIMELVSTRTLQALLDEDNIVISLDERLRFGIEVCSALHYLHGHQLVHLDVKPQNVLLGEHTRCKLADFGNLTRTRPGSPREDTDFTQLLGTLPYRAPELMKGQFPSNKADIYSLGITLWQMASRQMPHSGANPHWLIYQVTKNDARPVSHSTGSDVTEIRFCELYKACWDAKPGLRPEAEAAKRVLIELRQRLWRCNSCEEISSFTSIGSRLG